VMILGRQGGVSRLTPSWQLAIDDPGAWQRSPRFVRISRSNPMT
jgi:hypothetical protein